MAKFPVPKKKIVTDADVKAYYVDLVHNCLKWLCIDGYAFYVLLPGDPEFRENDSAGATICVEFPYKKFKVSIQEDSVKKTKEQPRSNDAYWHNVELSMFHECVHILVWRLSEIAARRYTTPTDVTDADEELTDHFAHLIHSFVLGTRRK